MPTPLPQNPHPDSSALDELFEVLTHESRRRVLYYLREHDGTVDVDELQEHLSEWTSSDPDEVGVVLHHAILPKLDEARVIDYESDREQVRYDGDSLVTELLEWIEDRERTK